MEATEKGLAPFVFGRGEKRRLKMTFFLCLMRYFWARSTFNKKVKSLPLFIPYSGPCG